MLSLLKLLPIQIIISWVACSLSVIAFLPLDYSAILQIEMGTLTLLAILVLVSLSLLHKMREYPSFSVTRYMIPMVLFWSILIAVLAKLIHFPFFLLSYSISTIVLLFCCFIFYFIRQKTTARLAFIPIGRALDIPKQIPNINWLNLQEPNISNTSISGIVTDLHSEDLTATWEKFLAEQTLNGTPVYHYRYIREQLTGRVRIRHLAENDLGSLLPSKNYTFIKHIIEILLIITTAPIILPISLIIAILIKKEDGGCILYKQQRIGLGNKPFLIYKFRTMKENTQQTVTVHNDDRITKIGHFLRKSRLDELPQFINVLKGEMSLIGPRAEFIDFAKELEQEVPFFSYRHIVKPGISGWAQVMQGYATGGEETKIKVEYDFYYIKHFSFSLDLLIFFKTLHTVLTGFGAR